MIRFAYHGKDRVVEPHDHDILNGSVQLLRWQVAGFSSRPLPNRLLTKVDEMTDLVLLGQTFPDGRPTASGKHIEWDVLSSGSNQPAISRFRVNPPPESALDPAIVPSMAQPNFGNIYLPGK
jgi:hypothetical protein